MRNKDDLVMMVVVYLWAVTMFVLLSVGINGSVGLADFVLCVLGFSVPFGAMFICWKLDIKRLVAFDPGPIPKEKDEC